MIKNRFVGVGFLGFSMMIALGGLSILSGCSSPCLGNPTEAGCGRLAIASISRIERVSSGSEAVEIQLMGLTGRSHPTVTLQSRANGIDVLLAVTHVGDDGVLSAQIDHPMWLPVGPALLTVQVGSQWAQEQTYVYNPSTVPVWGPPITASYPSTTTVTMITSAHLENATYDPLLVYERQSITDRSFSQCLEGYKPDGISRVLLKSGTPKVKNLCNHTKLTVLPEAQALAVVAGQYAYFYRHPAGIWFITSASLVDPMGFGSDTNLGMQLLQGASLFAADPEGGVFALAKDDQLQAGYLGGTLELISSYVPVLQWTKLTGTHAQFGDRVVNTVARDSNNEWHLLMFRDGVLMEEQNFSDALNARLNALNIAALMLKDIDMDGFADVVVALRNQDGAVDSIGWLSYKVGLDGSEQFTELQKVPLSSPITETNLLSDMAIADFNGDGKPDVALASPQMLYVYLNQAQ